MEMAELKDLNKVVVIGDQLETDVKMGNEMGADTVLVLTGISSLQDIEATGIRPKYAVRTLSEIL